MRAVVPNVMLTPYSFILMHLWTLCTFRPSFLRIDPLFSSSYKLFCKKHRGWVYHVPTILTRLSCRAALKMLLLTINRQNPAVCVWHEH